MMYKLKIYTSLVILSSYVDWFCFVFLFDIDNIDTGSSFIFSCGTTIVLFIGLTDIEIRRFTQKKQEFGLKYSNGNTVGNINTIQVQIEQQLTKHMGPLRPYRPLPAWKSTSMGFTPNPTTRRTLFMNSFLPEFYNAKYKYSNNSTHFVKQFHGNGRQLYQSKQQIDGT